MKYLLITTLIFLTTSCLVYSQNLTANDEFERFRKLRDESFRKPGVSPLLRIDLEKFNGLNYFPFDERLRIKAVFMKTGENRSFLMPTSTGGTRKYLKLGELKFSLSGREFVLGAYTYEWAPDHPLANEEAVDLFVPFRDLSNGDETYGGGRYVYLRKPADGQESILDFNTAHNPNCAYGNNSFACTLPPKENFLQIQITAGEKKFVSLGEKTAH